VNVTRRNDKGGEVGMEGVSDLPGNRISESSKSDNDTGLHPVLVYVALSGLIRNTGCALITGLHPVVRYVAPSGLLRD